MDLIKYLPEKITVTEQTFDITDFSEKWKTDVVHLAERIFEEYTKSGKKRFIAVLGGASGSSKSTMAIVLEHLLNAFQSEVRVLTIGQDGYHFTQEYLLQTFDAQGEALAHHKGRYDSFDVGSLKHDLDSFIQGRDVSFPLYSRKIHDPIMNAISCVEESQLLILEGLWLLYDKEPWNTLLSLYDFTVFIHTPPDIRKQNTITRHIRGNEHSSYDAEIFYEQSDAKNAELITTDISKHDFDFYYEK